MSGSYSMCCEGSWSIYYVYAVYVVYSRAIFDHVGMLQELEMIQLSTTGRALIDGIGKTAKLKALK